MQTKLGSVEKKTYQTFHSTVLVLFCVTRSSADIQRQTIKNILQVNAQKRASKLITEKKKTESIFGITVGKPIRECFNNFIIIDSLL